jgi:hypothetical protein
MPQWKRGSKRWSREKNLSRFSDMRSRCACGPVLLPVRPDSGLVATCHLENLGSTQEHHCHGHHCHPLSRTVAAVTHCHSLSPTVTHCHPLSRTIATVTHCHSLSPTVTLCHPLSLTCHHCPHCHHCHPLSPTCHHCHPLSPLSLTCHSCHPLSPLLPLPPLSYHSPTVIIVTTHGYRVRRKKNICHSAFFEK